MGQDHSQIVGPCSSESLGHTAAETAKHEISCHGEEQWRKGTTLSNTAIDRKSTVSSALHLNIAEVVQIKYVNNIEQPCWPTQMTKELVQEAVLYRRERRSKVVEDGHTIFHNTRLLDHGLIDIE